jgi:hypothetical protein
MARMSEVSRLKLWASITAIDDPIIGTGYINKHTLEVALLSSGSANYAAGGEDLFIQAKEDADKVNANPGDWLKIPKYDQAAKLRYGEQTSENLALFAQHFFEENSLPVVV